MIRCTRKQHLEYKDTSYNETPVAKTGIHIIPHRQVNTCIIHPNILRTNHTKSED